MNIQDNDKNTEAQVPVKKRVVRKKEDKKTEEQPIVSQKIPRKKEKEEQKTHMNKEDKKNEKEEKSMDTVQKQVQKKQLKLPLQRTSLQMNTDYSYRTGTNDQDIFSRMMNNIMTRSASKKVKVKL